MPDDIVDGLNIGDAGGGPATAAPVGTSSLVSGAVGFEGDKSDVYQVTVAETGLFVAGLFAFDTDILSDFSGQMSLSDNLGAELVGPVTGHELSYPVSAGEVYFLTILPDQPQQYKLNLSLDADPVGMHSSDVVDGIDIDDAGGSRETAALIAVDSLIAGSVGFEMDDSDFYRVDVTTNATLTVELSGLRADLDLLLIDDDSGLQASDPVAGTSSETVSYRVIADGTYFLEVAPVDSAQSDYVLRLSSEPDYIIDLSGPLYSSDIREDDGDVIVADDARLFRLYLGGLGREPDAGGFDWWAERIENGTFGFDEVANRFVDSPEFKGQADTSGDEVVSDEEFISHMYTNVFGREPDEAGRDWWLGQLAAGSHTHGSAFAGMVHSDEYVEETAATISDALLWA